MQYKDRMPYYIEHLIIGGTTYSRTAGMQSFTVSESTVWISPMFYQESFEHGGRLFCYFDSVVEYKTYRPLSNITEPIFHSHVLVEFPCLPLAFSMWTILARKNVCSQNDIHTERRWCEHKALAGSCVGGGIGIKTVPVWKLCTGSHSC